MADEPKFPVEFLIAEKRRRQPKQTFESLETLLVDPKLFGLTTATPVQRAICRVAEGLPLGDLANDPAVRESFGCDPELLPPSKPHQLAILSGIRVGKSLMAALLAIFWTQNCDVSKLGPGEIPRVSIVSLRTDLAEVVFEHVKGRIMASETLKKMVIDKPTNDSILLRHPTGTPVEICVVAGAKSGGSLVARWSAGCIFDEFTKMDGAGEAAVNWEDQIHNIRFRLLPGSQVVSIGNPWRPAGPAYEMYKSKFGKPSSELVVVKTPAWNLNPVWWTPERCAEAAKDPDKYVTECLGDFRSPEESLFSSVEIENAIRSKPVVLPYDPRCTYRAAMDPATRGNGWTLVITTRVGNRKIVAYAREWIGSKLSPLSSLDTLKEVAEACRQYHVHTIDTDQYHGDTLKDLGRTIGLHIRIVEMNEKERISKAMSFKTKMSMGEIEIPETDFNGSSNMKNDLLMLQKRSTTNGVKIVIPKTSDGRHGDYWPALLLAMSAYLDDVNMIASSTPEERLAAQADKMKAQRAAEVRDRMDKVGKWGSAGRLLGPRRR